jgi:hypothetical protein
MENLKAWQLGTDISCKVVLCSTFPALLHCGEIPKNYVEFISDFTSHRNRLRIPIRDKMLFEPLDPGLGLMMNFFRISDLRSRIQTTEF